MKFNELFTSANGIFTTFESDYPTEFAELFGSTLSTSLNNLALGLYGNKTLLAFLDSDNWNSIVSTFIGTHIHGWLRINDAITAEYDATKPYDVTETKTGGVTTQTSDSNNVLSAEKAFNDQNFTDNDREISTKSGSRGETYNVTNHRTGNSNSNSIAEHITKEIEVRKYNLQKEIIADIVGEITIGVYE